MSKTYTHPREKTKIFDDGIRLIFDASTISGGTLFWRPERQVVRRETDWCTHKEPYQRASMVLPATTMYCHSKGSRQLATAMRLSAMNIKISLFKLIIWLCL